MAGSVYVFNLTGDDIRLMVNGGSAPSGAIPGWSLGPGDRYRPNSGIVPYSASPDPGIFASGANQLVVSSMGMPGSAHVEIDPNWVPPGQDLLLMVERNQWQLVGSSGSYLAGGPLQTGFGGSAEVLEE